MEKRVKELFLGVKDPRIERTKKHPLESILYIVLCGTMAGVDSWIGFQDYAEEHEAVLKQFIDLPNGVPSHDTISRVISLLDVDSFVNRFEVFTQKLGSLAKGVIAIDGKTIRGSFDREKGVKARHIVSAWSESCKVVLGQVKVDEKSNEITAIPELLSRIDVQGQIITIDAMGCQRTICEEIGSRDGDYVISLKGNQGLLHDDVRVWFEGPETPSTHVFKEWDKGHGRIENRVCEACDDIAWLKERHNWPFIQSIARVHSTRKMASGEHQETRYYISSLPADAERIAKVARAHWGIENSLHWVLDVTMNEDKSRIRNENAPEILTIMRKWSLNLINHHKGNLSVKRMIRKFMMSPKNLLEILVRI